MCGLMGVIVEEGAPIRGLCDDALRALHHRGPNHAEMGVWISGGSKTCIGHTRLSIIDLADEANQPMRSVDGRFVIIFNGEIYNYIELRDELRERGEQFQTASDTEVLLKAWVVWGEECLQRLDGMFAFAVLDREKNTLTCVRDQFGVKPFFYGQTVDGFYFASELPALLALWPGKASADLQSAYDYLVHGDYDSSERTFVEGVCHLRPAHLIRVDVSTRKIQSVHQWWTPEIRETSRLSFSDAADAVREQFLLNVKRQLRSDVPLGAALSGGIDSSAVVCAMRHIEPDAPIHTFSYVAPDPKISEECWMDVVNDHVGAVTHKISASPAELAGDIDSVVHAQGEPFGSTSIYAQYKVFKLARDNGITVTLDGQGADEIFAGYSGYPGYRVMSLWASGQHVEALRFLKSWRSWPGRSYKSVVLDLARLLGSDALYKRARNVGGRSSSPAWLDIDMLRLADVRLHENRVERVREFGSRRVMEQLAKSLQHRGLPALLRHGDRNSMQFSIESRVPFLSQALCDLSYSLPESYLISDSGETKSVFRAAMRGIVPDVILDRRDKVGFATPEYRWFVELSHIYRGWLVSAKNIPFLNVKCLLDEFDAIVAGKKPFSWQVWRWVNYVRWYKMHLSDC